MFVFEGTIVRFGNKCKYDFLTFFSTLFYSLNIWNSLACACVWIPMMSDVGGVSDRMRVATRLDGVTNTFGHARANVMH